MRKIKSHFPGLNTLIVEDYIINQEVTQDILELMQCHVDAVDNGKDAILLCQKKFYDIIFMDIQMPDMDGLEITKQIRCIHYPNDKKPLIIALTASVLDNARERCIEAGMEDFIAKPMEAEKIEDILCKYFASREQSV